MYGLNIYVMCSYCGWYGWGFNHGNLGSSGDITVSSHGLPKPILVSGSVYDILWFYDIKTYAYYIFTICICIIKRNSSGL